MRISALLRSTAIIATAIAGLSSPLFAQCPGGNCPIPQNSNQNPYWQGNQNPNWQGNQTPNYRNDGGWNTQQNYYQNQGNGGNYYSTQPHDNSPYSNSSRMFDGEDNGSNSLNKASDNAKSSYLNNQPNANANQGYFYNNQQSNQPVNGQNASPDSNSLNKSNDNGKISYLNNQPTNNATQGYYYNTPKENQSPNGENAGPDSLLQHRVNDSLKNNYLRKNYDTVNARAYNGVVTLSGTVDNEDERQEVDARVREIKGVINVNDQIKVSDKMVLNNDKSRLNSADLADANSKDLSSDVTDQDLKKQAEEALKNNYVKKNYDTVIITVTNGVLTVSGIVSEDKDRQDILDRLQKIKGIKKINDRLEAAAVK